VPFITPAFKNTGDVIGAAGWNSYIRDNLTYLNNQAVVKHGCKLRNSNTFVIGNAAPAAVPFNIELEDTDNYHNTGTNTRITVPTGLDGIYAAWAYMRWTNFSPGAANYVGIQLNGTHLLTRVFAPDVAYSSVVANWVGYMVAGDYLEYIAYASPGGNYAIEPAPENAVDAYSPVLSAYKVG
jgi:hypothetical protein